MRASAPLSRPLLVTRLPPEGVSVTMEADEAERRALETEFGLPAIFALTGEFLVRGRHDRVEVTGRVKAEFEQICVVSLDPFRSTLDEPVAVSFQEPRPVAQGGRTEEGAEHEIEPDPIVDGRIDLGHVTAEFLALGLDPYPRKPGVSFEDGGSDQPASPFAALAGLREKR